MIAIVKQFQIIDQEFIMSWSKTSSPALLCKTGYLIVFVIACRFLKHKNASIVVSRTVSAIALESNFKKECEKSIETAWPSLDNDTGNTYGHSLYF